MCFGEILVIAELGEIIIVFHDSSTALYTVTSVHHKARFLQNSINVFRIVNLALFTVVIQKRTKARALKTSWKMARFKGQNKFIFKQFIQDFQ